MCCVIKAKFIHLINGKCHIKKLKSCRTSCYMCLSCELLLISLRVDTHIRRPLYKASMHEQLHTQYPLLTFVTVPQLQYSACTCFTEPDQLFIKAKLTKTALMYIPLLNHTKVHQSVFKISAHLFYRDCFCPHMCVVFMCVCVCGVYVLMSFLVQLFIFFVILLFSLLYDYSFLCRRSSFTNLVSFLKAHLFCCRLCWCLAMNVSIVCTKELLSRK